MLRARLCKGSATRTRTALLAAEGHQVLLATAITLDPKKTVLEQSALQVVFEFLAHEPGQVTAGALDLTYETRVMFSNDGIERSLFGPMPLVGRREWNRRRSRHRP